MPSAAGSEKQIQVGKENYVAIPKRETGNSIRNQLDKYIGESGLGLSNEDTTAPAIDYKKKYLELIDNLRKIVDNAEGI